MTVSAPTPPVEGPAASADDRWDARPVAARLLRAGIVLAPLVGSSAVLLVLSHLWRAPAGSRTVWLATMAIAAVAAAAVIERMARRLLPLASLLRLTMLFPDKAPSRLRIARSAGTTGQQLDRLARSDDDTAQVAAEKVLALITALGDHDRKTRGHSERVRLYCDLLAEQLRLPRAERDRLRWGALLHDIGKLEIAPTILNKPAKLSDQEFARIQQHPTVGAEIAAPLLPWLGEWGGGIVDHHERWDGRGYPAGRAAAEISRAGRIVGLVDAFETMTAARVYKKAMTTRAARIELAACAGSQFDPDYVRAFLAISLPRMLWAMGPLAFVVQLPFLRSLAKLGSQATQISVQGATTAGAAAAAGVIGVAASSAIAAPAHVHPHPHTHVHAQSAAAVLRAANGSSYQGGGVGPAGTSVGAEPVTDRSATSAVVPRSGDTAQPDGVHRHTHGVTSVASPHQGGGPPDATVHAPLALAPMSMYAAQGQLVSIDVLARESGDLKPTTMAITTAPAGGSATVNAQGRIAYQSTASYHGVDQVGYQVCDASGACGSTLVTINVLATAQGNSNYNGVDFSGTDLHGIDFSSANLRNVNFSGADLTGVNLHGADLTGAILTDAQLAGANLRNVTFVGAKLAGVDLSGQVLDGSNLTNADLSSADLAGASLAGVTVNGADLSGADLSGVTGGTAPQFAAINLTATIGAPVTINLSGLVSDPGVPIDWSTLQITKGPNHGTAKITGPHTIVYTPAPGLLSVDHVTISLANVLTFSGSSTFHIAVVL